MDGKFVLRRLKRKFMWFLLQEWLKKFDHTLIVHCSKEQSLKIKEKMEQFLLIGRNEYLRYRTENHWHSFIFFHFPFFQ